MNPRETPVTIGIEVEAHYAPSWPNEEIRQACTKHAHALAPYRFGASAGQSVSPGMFWEAWCHENPKQFEAPRLSTKAVKEPDGNTRHFTVHSWEKDVLPPSHQTPDGWETGWEFAHEFRFMGPTDTFREIFRRLDELKRFMNAWGLNNFSGCGTHIHTGVRSLIEDQFGKPLNRDTWHHSQAAKLLHGYIVSRAHQIHGITMPHRRQMPLCGPEGNGASGYTNTSLMFIHNNIVQRGLDYNYSYIARNRRNVPTFEFRMFSGMRETDTIKGYVALLCSMIKRAKDNITPTLVEELKTIPVERDSLGHPVVIPDTEVPTGGVLVRPEKYSVDRLKDEIREAGIWPDALCSWVDETIKRNGAPTPFEGSLDEIYNHPDNTDGEKVVNLPIPEERSVISITDHETAVPVAAVA